jgi:hypothetical protein
MIGKNLATYMYCKGQKGNWLLFCAEARKKASIYWGDTVGKALGYLYCAKEMILC